MSNKLIIEQVSNGWITRHEEGAEVHCIDVDKELEGMQSLLYSVLEFCGYYGSKHDERRLFIRIERQKP